MKKMIQKIMLMVLLSSALIYANSENELFQENKSETIVMPKGLYLGVGMGVATINEVHSTIEKDEQHKNMLFIAGYEINKISSIELRYTNGLKAKNALSEEYDINTLSIYYKPSIEIHEDLRIYGLVGYSDSKMSVEGAEVSSDIDGLSYGIGAIYKVANKAYIYYDYTKIYSNSTTINSIKIDTDIASFNIGLIYKF